MAAAGGDGAAAAINMPPCIVMPDSWGRVGTARFPVLAAGLPDADGEVAIWPADAFFAGTGAPLARVALSHRAGSWGLAWVDAPTAWGRCVAEIRAAADGARWAVTGFHHGLSPHTDAVAGPPAGAEAVPPALFAPVPWTLVRDGPLGAAETRDPGVSGTLSVLCGSADPGLGPFVHAPLGVAEWRDVSGMPRAEDAIGPPALLEGLCPPPRYRTEAPRLTHLADAYAVMGRGLCFAGGALWGPSARQALHGDTNLLFFRDFGRFAGETAYVRGAPLRRWRGGPVPALLSNAGAGNFGHWVMNSLFCAHLLRSLLEGQEIEFVAPPLTPFQRESLDVMGLGHTVREVTDERMLFDRLLFPSPLSTESNARPPSRIAAHLADLRDRVARRVGPDAVRLPNGGRFIYCTRLGFPSGRVMENEAELIDALRQEGFDCVAPHELGFCQEVACFARAEIICAPLGAALVNQGFAPPGCDVFELVPAAYSSNEFLFLAHILGHRVSRLVSPIPDEAVVAPGCFAYQIDIPAVVAHVRRIRERRARSPWRASTDDGR